MAKSRKIIKRNTDWTYYYLFFDKSIIFRMHGEPENNKTYYKFIRSTHSWYVSGTVTMPTSWRKYSKEELKTRFPELFLDKG